VRARLHLTVAATACIAACTDNSRVTAPAPEPPAPPAVSQQAYPTPMQARIAQRLLAREARGELVPSVSFEFQSAQGSSLAEVESKRYGPGEGYAYTAKTVLHYGGPAQAGLQRWPALTLRDDQARTLGVAREKLPDLYRAKMEKAHPGFWNRHQFGTEPRTYTITESARVVYPAAPPLAPADASATATTQDELVLGFSVPGPGIHESWSFGFEDVEEVVFSFDLDWGLGVRLPIAGQLDSPEPLAEGSTYSATSTVEGRNWSSTQYADAGLQAQSGDEVYVFFVAQACAQLSGVVDAGGCAGPNFRRARDFTTPFGPGVTVPFPTVSVPIVDEGVAGIDFDVTPAVGSDKITAHWSVFGEAFGSGNVLYTDPTSAATLSPVTAVDGPGLASFSLGQFRYYFNQFTLSPAVRVWVDVEIPVLPDWEDSWSFGLGTYDLSDFIGSLDLSVGVHAGSSPTGLTLDVPIVNVAPTADITLVGGQQMTINGIPTVVANVGDNFTFTGMSHDPGRDGLTLSWDWGDGPPTPDESALYPVPGPTGPNNATDVRTHAFGRACLYDVTLQSVDDDAAVGEDHASILITEQGRAARLDGYWQRQLGRTGTSVLDASVMDCYLAIVGRVSSIFSEVRDASTMAAAYDVVNVRQSGDDEVQKLDRDILVAWLNFASGAIGYSQMVDTDGDGVADTMFRGVMAMAEAARVNPLSTVQTLRAYSQLLHHISQQFAGA
jgi:hypothetical protein